MGKCESLCKILAIERILQDNDSGITTNQIIEKLYNLYGINAERKSIYSNINALTRFMPINVKRQGRYMVWHLER